MSNYMQIQIDQSIKIEQTNKSTALAFSNNEEYAIIISAKVKRQLQELFRKQGKPRIFVYRTFAACVAILLQGFNFHHIIIDEEYTGKERLLRSMIYEILGRLREDLPNIQFQRIGKKSKAHGIAYSITAKNRKPDREVSYNEIKRLVLP